MTVKSITALQPHFMQPWLFLSWNLSYNVSVEMDRLNDMYFYISRGINLLAEGEALNRYHPDMRYMTAFYYQNKFGVSDKVTTLRSLLHLSCMSADDRNPDSLLTAGEVDLVKFKTFCENNPQFVRRLRETAIKIGKKQERGRDVDRIQYLAKEPKDVVAFLRDNQKLPGRYRKDDPRKLESRILQFPVVPPFFTNGERELKHTEDWRDGQATAMLAARAWFKYANEAAPPPNPVPGQTDFNYRDPERKRRVPRSPMLIIFLQGPPRAQSYIAKQLAEDGWFDSDPWIVDQGFGSAVGDKRWFADEVKIKPSANAGEAWTEAHTMWSNHGRDNGLNFTTEQFNRYQNDAALYAQRRHFQVPNSMMMTDVPQPRPDELEDPRLRHSIEANVALSFYYRNRQVTNYESFLVQADAEMDPLTIRARRLIYQADRYHRFERKTALSLYEQVLGKQSEIEDMRAVKPDENRLIWARMLMTHKNFAAQEKAQEDTYEIQLRYLRLVQESDEPKYRRHTMALFLWLQQASLPSTISAYQLAEMRWLLTDKYLADLSQRVEPFWPPGPFDGVNPETNNLWVSDHVKQRVLMNAGLVKAPSQPPTPPAGAQVMPPPGPPK